MKNGNLNYHIFAVDGLFQLLFVSYLCSCLSKLMRSY